MIQKTISLFSSDFESVFAYHLTDKILSFDFYPKAVYFECTFWISRSATKSLASFSPRSTSFKIKQAMADHVVKKIFGKKKRGVFFFNQSLKI